MISWTWCGRVWNDNISDNGLTASESQVGGGGMGSIMFAKERVYCDGDQVEVHVLPFSTGSTSTT